MFSLVIQVFTILTIMNKLKGAITWSARMRFFCSEISRKKI